MGCGEWKPWCNGGAPDVRCDECVGTELTLIDIEVRAAEIASMVATGDMAGIATMSKLETGGWDRHELGHDVEGDIFVSNDRNLMIGWLAREIHTTVAA